MVFTFVVQKTKGPIKARVYPKSPECTGLSGDFSFTGFSKLRNLGPKSPDCTFSHIYPRHVQNPQNAHKQAIFHERIQLINNFSLLLGGGGICISQLKSSNYTCDWKLDQLCNMSVECGGICTRATVSIHMGQNKGNERTIHLHTVNFMLPYPPLFPLSEFYSFTLYG